VNILQDDDTVSQIGHIDIQFLDRKVPLSEGDRFFDAAAEHSSVRFRVQKFPRIFHHDYK